MSRLIIMGGGISGHNAATFARKWLSSEHEVIVVTPNKNWNYVPSNIWVSMGKIKKDNVLIPLAPVYKKCGIQYKQAKAVSIHPEGNKVSNNSYIKIKYTSEEKKDAYEELHYDYLINATGPKFNYGATSGLGTNNILGEHTVSVCTADESKNAYSKLQIIFQKAKEGKRQKVLVGTSHGTCGCQAAALMYLLNVEQSAEKEGIRDMLDLKWITNESFLGDFGIGGLHMKKGDSIVSSKVFTEKLFNEKNISWIIGAHVYEVKSGKIKYELLNGDKDQETFDLAMLFPQFVGTGLLAFNKSGSDITAKLFASNGFMIVDANYSKVEYENRKSSDWPKTYQNPTYNNIFACGTAFAPPYPISKITKSTNGTPIFPGAPRAGMPSSIIGKVVAKSICNKIMYGENSKLYESSMAEMGSVCFVTAGMGFRKGIAATLTVFPIVPNFKKYPEYGRDLKYAFGELSLAGHWSKVILHHLMCYKAKLKFGWSKIL